MQTVARILAYAFLRKTPFRQWVRLSQTAKDRAEATVGLRFEVLEV